MRLHGGWPPHTGLFRALAWAKHCGVLRAVRRETRGEVLERARGRRFVRGEMVVALGAPMTAIVVLVSGRCTMQLPLTVAYERKEQETAEKAQAMVEQWARNTGLDLQLRTLANMKASGVSACFFRRPSLLCRCHRSKIGRERRRLRDLFVGRSAQTLDEGSHQEVRPALAIEDTHK
eukprot:SAG11_NODE_1537_length_4724_cov_4.318270_6_plen_177_part_00